MIIGAGGHGRVVLDILRCAGTWQVVGFLDANPALVGRRVDGVPVLGGLEVLPGLCGRSTGHVPKDGWGLASARPVVMESAATPPGTGTASAGVAGAVVAIGDNGVRRAYADEVERIGIPLINAIHPSAHLASSVTLGRNVVIAAGTLICAHCQIGDSAILNTGCIVDHESMIGTGAHVCPGARLAGRVAVQSGAFIGIGATVLQGLRIGCDAVVGGGAVVVRDVEPMTTVAGVPARVLRGPPGASAFGRMNPAFGRVPSVLQEVVPAGTR